MERSLCYRSVSFVPSVSFVRSSVPSVRPSVRPSVHPFRPSVRQSVSQSVCPSVRPSVRQSVRPSICQSVRPSVRPFVRPFVRPSVSQSVRPFVRSSVRSSVRLSVSPSVRSSVRPFVRPSVRPSVSQSVRPFVRSSVRPSVCQSVRPSVRPFVRPSVRPAKTEMFRKQTTGPTNAVIYKQMHVNKCYKHCYLQTNARCQREFLPPISREIIRVNDLHLQGKTFGISLFCNCSVTTGRYGVSSLFASRQETFNQCQEITSQTFHCFCICSQTNGLRDVNIRR